MGLIAQLKEMDNRTRVRIILGLLVAQLIIIFLFLGAITVTSQPSFCNVCHEMRADVQAWKKSSHAEVTCIACHSEGGTVKFLLHKAASLKEPYLHFTGNFEKPINAQGKYGREMSNEPCRRCHSLNRKITPSEGVIIDHLKHEQEGITCVTCHNRVGHPEMRGYLGEKLNKSDGGNQVSLRPGKEIEIPPETRPYQDRTRMRFCMQCHTGRKNEAPKECKTCHPPGFELKPADHSDPAWLPSGEQLRTIRAAHGREAKTDIGNCVSCHQQKSCNDCHQSPMPHPATWKKVHGKEGKAGVEKCIACHTQPNFCQACHHRYDPAKGPWYSPVPGTSIHPFAVREKGTSECFDCHNPVYCARCHVRGSVE
jgi:cytochrome c nitrite reductase small subunit